MAESPSRQDQHNGNETFLCLKCRSSGHLAGNCTNEEKWVNNNMQFRWFFSPQRRTVAQLMSSTGEMCQRCRDLDLIHMLRTELPWNSPQDLIKAQQEGHSLIRQIGEAGTVEFRVSCPVCICLFAMTPSPASASDQILLFPDWTWNRLAGENGTDLDREEKRRYAKCLLVAVQPNSTIISFYVRGHRGDAMCIAETDLLGAESLGGRAIQDRGFNLDQCKRWLASCSQLHGSDCEPEFTDELIQIRLVDVDARIIVPYPGSPCDYVALSYVWGGVEQNSYHTGSQLVNLPKTIEDAIKCTKLLGKKYLWVDSLCIDQNDDIDKGDQINRMWSIYRGSSITLITLSSPSADSGIAGFSEEMIIQPQLSCTIDGIRLLGLMPTLSQCIWSESWGSRAWTLQEALLSHRCLYLSDHQLYFECETIQYCESLDERNSWGHNLTALATPDRQHWLTWVMEQNGSGCLRNLLDTPADRFLHWGQKVTLYSYRMMTKQKDGLSAFSGILQRLQSMYPAGFFWGLPIEDFNWGLLWQAQWPPRRRSGFPSWCWAGWQAGMMTPFPMEVKDPHRTPVPLRVWKTVGKKLVMLFESKERSEFSVERSGPRDPARDNDSVEEGERKSTTTAETDWEQIFQVSQFVDGEEYALFIECFSIQLKPDWSRPTHARPNVGLRGHFIQDIAGMRCSIYMLTSDIFIENFDHIAATPKYLILAKNEFEQVEELLILAVYDVGGFCVRGTSLSLVIPRGSAMQVLQSLQLQKEHIVLS